MNQTLPTADLNTAGTTDVIPSVAIDRIIAQRNEGIALFMQAMECLATARKILLDASGDIFLYGFEDCVTDSVRRIDKPEEAKRNITRLADRKIWDRLMTDTGMCQRQDYWPFFAIFNVRYWSLMLSAFRHFIITDWRGVFCQHSRFAFFL